MISFDQLILFLEKSLLSAQFMFIFSKPSFSVLDLNLLALHFPYIRLSHIILQLLSFLVADSKRVFDLRLLILNLNFVESISLSPLFILLVKTLLRLT